MNKHKIVSAAKAGALFVISSLIVGGAGIAAPALAAPTKESPKREGFNEPLILAHLKHVKVVVGKLDAYATDNGASAEHIKQLLTDGLAPMHLTLVDESGSGKSGSGSSMKECGPSDTPLMYLKLKVAPDSAGAKTAACSVSLSLVEKAKVARNKKDLMVAVWSEESVSRLSDNFKEGIDKQVESVLKNFHRDYMLANSADSSRDVPTEDEGQTKKKHKSPR